MLSKKLKIAWLILLFIGNSGCERLGIKVEIPSTEWCSSMGKVGASCQNSTNSSIRRRMTLDEWYKFLQATPDKGPALCASSKDFEKVKTAIDLLCYKAGKHCTLEQKKLIESLGAVSENLKQDAVNGR